MVAATALSACVVLSAAASATAGGAKSARTAAAGIVRVVDCRTSAPLAAPQRPPQAVRVLGSPASTHGLVAYGSSYLLLIGPSGWRCTGSEGADGNADLVVWPPHVHQPSMYSRTDGITLEIDPACVSCKAATACPLLSSFVSTLGYHCTDGIPRGERVYALRSSIVLFDDPPGVPGDGWPSGGPNPANGLVGVSTTRGQPVYRATCTLPAAEHSTCTVILNEHYCTIWLSAGRAHKARARVEAFINDSRARAPARRSTPRCVALMASDRDSQEVHTLEILEELRCSAINGPDLWHIYDARLRRHLADNNRIWITGALLLPASVAGIAVLGAVSHPTLADRILIGSGSVTIVVVWNLFADLSRGFQARSEAWMTAIERYLGLPKSAGSSKAAVPRWAQLWPLAKVHRVRWLLVPVVLAYWVAAILAFGQ